MGKSIYNEKQNKKSKNYATTKNGRHHAREDVTEMKVKPKEKREKQN